MKHIIVEVYCNICGHREYYSSGLTSSVLRSIGWIVKSNNKCFCDKDCYNEYREIKKQK